MNARIWTPIIAAALAVASPALAQVEVRITPPSVVFSVPPPLVVITPGVQVVENYDREVFFVDGYYWHCEGDHWFRTTRHDGGWTYVERTVVPTTLVKYPRGKYKHFKSKKTVVHADGHGNKTKVVTTKVKHGGPGHHGGKHGHKGKGGKH